MNEPQLQTENQEIQVQSPLETFVQGLERCTVWLNIILHKISSVFLMVLMFLTAADVAGRYFFNKPITGTYELTALLLAIMVFFSMGTGQIYKNHIEIDFFTKKFSEPTQQALRNIFSFVLFVLLALMAWQLYNFTVRIWASGETSGDLGIPLYLITGFSIIGVIAFALTLLLDSLQAFLKAVNSK
ncbi:TRAP transporter small permease [Calidifontibacillus erzurumensis]|uniref:TRAP transporter small permease n=1 Tax=Calidifontibacillus erzurumensis TaxID=2741433 RepID=A0A8J8GB69_9BACI|nr:TRAP transporter small permease [Calidifontibacillus erzurumensis]NSL50584.1 TRAP transporter small permease [Calidifontibacillus erzurumensis]